MKKLALAMICKDEASTLPRLLEIAQKYCDEMILVDTGSFDDSKTIAEKYGCKVYDFEWINNYEKARNFSFSKCIAEYTVWL